jgi:hypothetical protein
MRAMRVSGALIAGVLAWGGHAVALGAGTGDECAFSGPVVSHLQGGSVVKSAVAGRAACAGPIDFPTSETNIAVTPKGTVLFSPAKTENSMARSTDSGATWNLTYPEDEQYTSLWNTVDPVLVVDHQTGRIFWAHATGATRTLPVLVSQSPLPDGVPTALAAASGFQVYSSSDEGRTFKTADYQTAPVGDWEKLMVGPPPANASAAERPTGYPNIVYLCGNSPFEVTGPGRICYRSLDGGLTFAVAGYVTPSSNMPADSCPPLAANTGVVAGDGTIYQPVSCNSASYLAVSGDEGANYSFRQVPGAPPSNGLSGSLQIVMDGSGALYAEWVADDKLVYAVSRDQARTWGKPVVLSAPGVHVITRPAPAAGARGRFGVAYYGSTDAKATKLTLYVTQTADALESDPLFYSGALNDPAHPFYTDNGVTGASPRADYIGATFDAGGTLWAGGVEQLAAPDANGHQATTGYVGRLLATTPGSAPAATPEKGSKTRPAQLPGRRSCRSRRAFTIHLYEPRRPERLVSATVYVNGKRVAVRRGRRLTARIDLRGLPRGAIRVTVIALTDHHRRLVSTRTYHPCIARTKS